MRFYQHNIPTIKIQKIIEDPALPEPIFIFEYDPSRYIPLNAINEPIPNLTPQAVRGLQPITRSQPSISKRLTQSIDEDDDNLLLNSIKINETNIKK